MPAINPRVTGTDNVRYLRVSDVSQVKTDYDPEGNSIPAQRIKCGIRERGVGSVNVAEFIDPGKSAKSIDQREDFIEMIAYVKAHPNVKYVSVYALSRFARNRYDDAIFMMQLEKLGVTLISATELNLDSTPAGKAMHGMIAVFNEYQVNVSGEDISYKMGQKVIAHGGTIGRALLGYQNVTEKFDGHKVNTIAVDQARTDYVRDAFSLFATGEYTEETLLETLTDMGLTMPKTAKLPERPVSKSTLGDMLRSRYYIGEVKLKGQWYPGRHEALISPALFERVQEVLDSHSGAGTRKRKHNHYLKGVFWCKRCNSRMGMTPANGNGGTYYYYFCLGARRGVCDQPYVLIEDLEKETLRYYAHVQLSEAFRQEVTTQVEETLQDEQSVNDRVRKRHNQRLKELDKQEDRLVDQLGDPDWPQDKLRAKVIKVRHEKQTITAQLQSLNVSLEVGRTLLLGATELLANPQKLYEESDRTGRRLMTLTIFGKLYVDTNKIVDHVLNEPYDALLSVEQRHQAQTPETRTYRRTVALSPSWGSSDDLSLLQEAQNSSRGTILADDAPTVLTSTDLLDLALGVQGSNKAAMVEYGGFEPPTSCVRCRRSTK